MMFNVPSGRGTTGHRAVGDALRSSPSSRPYAACLAVSVACSSKHSSWRRRHLSLWRQQFQHGLCPAFTGYFVYHGVKKLISSDIIAAGIGSYVGIVAAFCAAVEFRIQLRFTDAAGQAPYCPYPLSISDSGHDDRPYHDFWLGRSHLYDRCPGLPQKTSPDLFQMTAPASSSKSLFDS